MTEGTRRQTTMSPPVHLPEPTPPPEPVPGCDICAALDRQRAAAMKAGDYSLASDYSVEISRHPHEGQS
ncbi:hypothetical protein ACWD5Q_06480 [Streptomyces sp. NPDC002513]